LVTEIALTGDGTTSGVEIVLTVGAGVVEINAGLEVLAILEAEIYTA
jgi:hypothetical protein